MSYPDDDDPALGGTPGVLVVENVEDRTKEPPLYEVLLHNLHTRHLAREAGYPLRCTLQEAGA